MPKTVCMVFNPAGEFETVYSDIIVEAGASTIRVDRFSNVEFEDGFWVARLPNGSEICRHASREVCLQLEANIAAEHIRKSTEGAE